MPETAPTPYHGPFENLRRTLLTTVLDHCLDKKSPAGHLHAFGYGQPLPQEIVRRLPTVKPFKQQLGTLDVAMLEYHVRHDQRTIIPAMSGAIGSILLFRFSVGERKHDMRTTAQQLTYTMRGDGRRLLLRRESLIKDNSYRETDRPVLTGRISGIDFRDFLRGHLNAGGRANARLLLEIMTSGGAGVPASEAEARSIDGLLPRLNYYR